MNNIICLSSAREVLTRRTSYNYVTVIDITSQIYHFELHEDSKKYVTITTPFGKYHYKRLPMGIKISPAYAQAIMTTSAKGYFYRIIFLSKNIKYCVKR